MRNRIALLATAAFFASVGVAAAQGGQGGGGARGQQGPPPPLRLMSTGVTDGQKLADKFTCAAGNDAVSPALQWAQAPRDTVSFALIVHDMDPRMRKGNEDILHWMVWDIPASANMLPENVSPASPDLPDGSHQTNGFAGPAQNGQPANYGYRAPCPPQNVALPHHYAFELYALDTKLDLPPTATRADVLKAMEGHIAGHVILVAPYNR